jgi:hypothetical protein
MNEGTSHLDASYLAIGIENEMASFNFIWQNILVFRK